jgi:hypothetical protein
MALSSIPTALGIPAGGAWPRSTPPWSSTGLPGTPMSARPAACLRGPRASAMPRCPRPEAGNAGMVPRYGVCGARQPPRAVPTVPDPSAPARRRQSAWRRWVWPESTATPAEEWLAVPVPPSWRSPSQRPSTVDRHQHGLSAQTTLGMSCVAGQLWPVSPHMRWSHCPPGDQSDGCRGRTGRCGSPSRTLHGALCPAHALDERVAGPLSSCGSLPSRHALERAQRGAWLPRPCQDSGDAAGRSGAARTP